VAVGSVLLAIALLVLFLVLLVSLVLSVVSSAFPGKLNPAPLVIAPDWRLFGPRPISTDRHLVARRKEAAGDAYGPWENLWSQSDPRFIRCLWNPERRLSTAFYQVESQLSRAARSGRDVAESPPWLVLRDIALAAVAERAERAGEPAGAGGFMQFAVLSSTRSGSRVRFGVVMVSASVPLPASVLVPAPAPGSGPSSGSPPR
jgi:hypothetical protein